MNLTVTIDTSDRLHTVLTALANAMTATAATPTLIAPQASAPQAAPPIPPPARTAQPTPQTTIPTTPATAPSPTVAPPPAAPATAIPTTAPTYTADQIAQAGALLLEDPQKMEALQALNARFGVQSLRDLPPEHYGAYVTELRALGAKI